MRIWIVNHYATTPEEPGGTRHITLARELVARGHDVTLVASSFSHNLKRETRLQPGETVREEWREGVRIRWVRSAPYRENGPSRLLNMLSFAWRVWTGQGTRGLPAPEVVLGSSPHLFAAWAAQALAARHRVPFLVEVRDIWPQTLLDLGRISPLHPLILVMAAIERHLYRRASRIITLLPGAAGHMVEKGARATQVCWVPNGVDASLFPEPTPIPESASFTVLYAGAHGLANGLDLVLEAAALLQHQGEAGVRFRLVGDGPEKPRLMAKAQSLQLRNVAFEDPVPKQAVAGLMAQSQACLMTLLDSPLFRWGISPNKLFDYLAAGRPVLFGVSSPFNPVATEGAGRCFRPGDPGSLAQAVLDLRAEGPAQWAAMGQKGRAYVLENHDFKVLAARLEAALAKAVAEGAA